MKLLLPVLGITTLLFQAVEAKGNQWYPLNRKEEIPAIKPFSVGDFVPLECITRNIDNGEHKFDESGKIIYGAFPSCKETGKPLSFSYGVNEDINCTIGFTDELYHLFQLYIHQDSPFSCRVPISNEAHSIENGGAHIPLTFNLRGEIHDSHLDIDHHLNVLFTRPSTNKQAQNSVISSIAWASGTNTTRVVIGDYLTLNLAVRWYDYLKNGDSQAEQYNYNGLPYPDGFYKLPLNSIPISYSFFCFYLVIVSLASGAIMLAFAYNFMGLKFARNSYRSLDAESKRD